MEPEMEPEAKRPRGSDVGIEIRSYVGKMFRFTKNPTGKGKFAHRVYEGPPNGDDNRPIPASAVYVDFNESYRITAVFENEKWTAFEFEVAGQKVWTNARKWHEWWVATDESQSSV